MSGMIERSNVDITEELVGLDRGAAELPGQFQGAGYREPDLADDLQYPLVIEGWGREA
ncbi:hypothetical protein AB5I41_22365 [Sphingomonas sp. MMS24-JH45]